ncbi:MAG: hypothetical protein ACR2LF_02490 [Jatrophihabitantaceae bacterium]
MNSTHLSALFTGLLDDAALYPPADLKLPEAVAGHARHRLSWYSELLGPFVCNVRRLPILAGLVEQLGLAPFDVAAVVPDGLDDLPYLRAAQREHPALRLRAIEVPLKQHRLSQAITALAPHFSGGLPCYVEIAVSRIDERHVHELSAEGLRLKLRTGGTSIDTFHSEPELAAPIVMCAAERLAFKCTAGLHNAVRHRDTATKFEHHGFLNVILAARVAAASGSASATAASLREQDPLAVAEQVGALSAADVPAIRAMFCSFGTCSIDEPVADLVAMGLVKAP